MHLGPTQCERPGPLARFLETRGSVSAMEWSVRRTPDPPVCGTFFNPGTHEWLNARHSRSSRFAGP
jgi:hypothetical protein